MTKVKICGLTELCHIKAAVEAEVDAIGFVFAPSDRRVTLEQAVNLAQYIPGHITKVGVFVNAPAETIKMTAALVPLDVIQYHGEETEEQIKNIGLPAIKSFSIATHEDFDRSSEYSAMPLFDAPGVEYNGGSGRSFDWQLMQKKAFANKPYILAGGLNIHNVKEAIDLLHPYMVDVSSGVEIEKRKDEKLIRAFIRQVKIGDEKT